MVADPINFVNLVMWKGSMCVRYEKGENPPWEGNWEGFKYMKFKAKKLPTYSEYYNWQLDMKKDTFLDNLTDEEKAVYQKRLEEHYVARTEEIEYYVWCMKWYFIVHGGRCGLYQEVGRYWQLRDELHGTTWPSGALHGFMVEGAKGFSWKGAAFHSLKDAKDFVQYCRDEEGAYWQWPALMPIYWKPLGEEWEHLGEGSLTTDEEVWEALESGKNMPELEHQLEEARGKADIAFENRMGWAKGTIPPKTNWQEVAGGWLVPELKPSSSGQSEAEAEAERQWQKSG